MRGKAKREHVQRAAADYSRSPAND